MTAPDDLVEVSVPAEQLVEGDVLVIDTVEHHVDRVFADAVPDFVYAFVPDQLPIPRGDLVAVRRPRSRTTLADREDPIAVQLAEVRDLALALADQAGKDTATGTASSRARVADHADRVRARLQPDEPAPTPPAPSPAPAPPAPTPAPAPAPLPAPAPPTRLDTTGKGGKP